MFHDIVDLQDGAGADVARRVRLEGPVMGRNKYERWLLCGWVEGHVNILGVGHIEVTVGGRGILKQVAVEASLLSGQNVGSVDVLPVLGLGLPAVEQGSEARGLAVAGGELVDENAAEEGRHGDDGTGLR